MSITPSIPVVQGSGKSTLQYEGDALLLTRRHDEVRIPLAAIAQVRTAGRSLTVELTAPAGATSYAHRIDGVSEASAAMFAAAVNAALPEAAGRDTTADGTALVETRTRPVSARERKIRLVKWWSAATVAPVVLLCVLIGVAGEPVGIVLFVPLGFVAAASALTSLISLNSWYREFRLTRHGITTLAVEAPDRRGMYLYTDPAGLVRHVLTWPGRLSTKISYDPANPADVILPRSTFFRRGELFFGLFCALCAVGFYATMIAMVVQTFTGSLDLSEPA
ncbi:hypothetical protein R1T08_15455 [Streptomyces sp. SBC-4]|nr:hypothetical protein [Streptomyces sp. SBC-4]MDV5145569.1 hypothetical protein [Streptomyces sp. SBC-4]